MDKPVSVIPLQKPLTSGFEEVRVGGKLIFEIDPERWLIRIKVQKELRLVDLKELLEGEVYGQ